MFLIIMHIENYRKKFKKFTSAFGLIEIMIAATLLSIGLLGAASIQTQSLNMTVESSLRETAGKMRTQLSNFILTMENSELQAMVSAPASTVDDACNNTNCSFGDFYATLLVGWENSLNLLLPQGRGCLCLTSTNLGDPLIRVAVQWVNLSGVVRQDFFDTQIISSTTLTGNSCTTPNANNNTGCQF